MGGFSRRILGSLLKTGLSLIGNVLKLLAKNILIPFGSTTTASGSGAAIHKKMFGSGFITRCSDLDCSHEESGLLIKGVSGTIENEAKEQKGGFLSM